MDGAGHAIVLHTLSKQEAAYQRASCRHQDKNHGAQSGTPLSMALSSRISRCRLTITQSRVSTMRREASSVRWAQAHIHGGSLSLWSGQMAVVIIGFYGMVWFLTVLRPDFCFASLSSEKLRSFLTKAYGRGHHHPGKDDHLHPRRRVVFSQWGHHAPGTPCRQRASLSGLQPGEVVDPYNGVQRSTHWKQGVVSSPRCAGSGGRPRKCAPAST